MLYREGGGVYGYMRVHVGLVWRLVISEILKLRTQSDPTLRVQPDAAARRGGCRRHDPACTGPRT